MKKPSKTNNSKAGHAVPELHLPHRVETLCEAIAKGRGLHVDFVRGVAVGIAYNEMVNYGAPTKSHRWNDPAVEAKTLLKLAHTTILGVSDVYPDGATDADGQLLEGHPITGDWPDVRDEEGEPIDDEPFDATELAALGEKLAKEARPAKRKTSRKK